MMTVKQIERSWSAKHYERLFRDLTVSRSETVSMIEVDGDWSIPAAAMALIRMDELIQSHVPLYRQLLRAVVVSQGSDGSWGDPAITALCLRALLCGDGQGLSIERGMDFLARLQKPEGLWPKYPLRRMPEDALVSAFILFELGDQPAFQSAVRMDDVVGWFESNESFLGGTARDLWSQAARRCRAKLREVAVSWS